MLLPVVFVVVEDDETFLKGVGARTVACLRVRVCVFACVRACDHQHHHHRQQQYQQQQQQQQQHFT